MRLLGVSCGEIGGSAEILLRAAMAAADRPELELQLVRLADLQIPFGLRAGEAEDGDDTWWFWEQLLEADALLIATPIYSRTVPGTLRLLADRLLGPNADAAFVQELLALRAAGNAPAVPFRVDERVLKPRVAGFIACGGSLPDHWKTLALPLLHPFTYSMQIGVVDQVQFGGAGTPSSIVLDPEAIERARLLGSRVAGQVGRPFEEVEYQGPEGLCPMCHLDVIAVKSGEEIECATCGARGRVAVRGGAVVFEFPDGGRDQSVISMAEKRAHFFEVQETAAAHAQRTEEIRERARELLAQPADVLAVSAPART